MSPANVYRFFASKTEIHEAVVRRLLNEIEVAVGEIVQRSDQANQKLRAVIAAIEKAHAKRLQANPKLHELIEAAFNENWAIAYQHRQKIEKSLTAIIS